VINVLYTQVGLPFKNWVAARVEERNERMVKDNFIEMDPAIEAAFRASTHVSRKYYSNSC
jgi:hypothetical protein